MSVSELVHASLTKDACVSTMMVVLPAVPSGRIWNTTQKQSRQKGKRSVCVTLTHGNVHACVY